MNCNETRRHWNLYHDSEGDAELHFQIGEHLAVCPGCAQWFSQQSRLEELLADKLAPAPPTRELWNQVLVGAGLSQPASSRKWILFSAMAASVMLLLGTAVVFHLAAPRASASLSQLSAEWHERWTKEPNQLDFHSTDDLKVENYLRERVSFPVRCPPRRDAGFAVQGAGTCELAQQSAAYLAGHVDQTPVSIFILPREGLDAFPHQKEAVRREKRHRCREGAYAMVLAEIDRNAVLVVGETEPEKLDKVLDAYGSYPHQ